jgi:hypothetical protein
MKAVGGDDLLLGGSRGHLRPRQRSARECSARNSGRVCGGDGWISAARLKKQNGSSSDTRDRGEKRQR